MAKIGNRIYPTGIDYLLKNGNNGAVPGMARLVSSNWMYNPDDETQVSVTSEEIASMDYAPQAVSIQFRVDGSYSPPRIVLSVTDVEFPAIEAAVFAFVVTLDGGPPLLALQEPSGLSSYPMQLTSDNALKVSFPEEGALSIMLPNA